MLEGDYEIYMVADASGGTTQAAHDFAMQRMVQAGVVPVTWQQVLLEWQRDWAHRETYDAVMAIAKSILARTGWASTTRTRWSTRPRAHRDAARVDRARSGEVSADGPRSPMPVRRVRGERAALAARAADVTETRMPPAAG